jgi:hypothetical protein
MPNFPSCCVFLASKGSKVVVLDLAHDKRQKAKKAVVKFMRLVLVAATEDMRVGNEETLLLQC